MLIGLPAAVPIAEGTIASGDEVPGGQMLGVEGDGPLGGGECVVGTRQVQPDLAEAIVRGGTIASQAADTLGDFELRLERIPRIGWPIPLRPSLLKRFSRAAEALQARHDEVGIQVWARKELLVCREHHELVQHLGGRLQPLDAVKALHIAFKLLAALRPLPLLEGPEGGILTASRWSASVRPARHDAGSSGAVTPCSSSRRANWWTFSTLN